MKDKKSSSIQYIFFLDYLRIFACLSVLIAHKFKNQLLQILNDVTSAHAIPTIIYDFFTLLIDGIYSVPIFFLISGYVISHVLYNDSTTSFLIKRFFRIYPLYIFAVLLQYAIQDGPINQVNTFNPTQENPITERNLLHIIIQLSLLGDFFNVPHALAGVEWTLRIELLFYLFMAGIRNWIPDGFNNKWVFHVLCSLALSFLMMFWLFPKFPLFSYGLFLLIGAAFYLLETKIINIPKLLSFLCFVFLIAIGMAYIEYGEWPEDYSQNFVYFAVSIFALSWAFREKFSLNKGIILLSQLTFAIYLFHNWLFDVFKEISESTWITLILLMTACYLAHILIEKPFFALGERLANRFSSRD